MKLLLSDFYLEIFIFVVVYFSRATYNESTDLR